MGAVKAIWLPAKFVSVLRQFHEGMSVRVVVGGEEFTPFQMSMGVKHGCIIAPVPFNLYVILCCYRRLCRRTR